MVRSMTAYSRAHFKCRGRLFLIELHSINRKGLEIQTHLNKEFFHLDIWLRKQLLERVKRGMVTVRLSEQEGAQRQEVLSLEEAQRSFTQLSELAEKLGYMPHAAVPFSLILERASLPPPSLEEGKELEEALMEGLEEALKDFIEMKEREGGALAFAITCHIRGISKLADEVAPLAKAASGRYRERLEARLKELESYQEDEERLLREVALFAERVDVTEEHVRLLSHIQQFEKLLTTEKVSVGRELDFIVQEMHREVSTLSSKSQELEIIQRCLVMKGAIDKIREQLQNIE